MFLTAVKDKAGSWCKTIQSVLRQTDYFFQQLIDDFNSEFHDRTNKKKNNGRSHNAQKGKGGNNNSRDNKPAWNKNGEPLCFNCGKYGHLAKDCPEPQKEKQNGKGKKGKQGRNGGRSQGNNNNQSNSARNTRGNTRGGGPGEEQFIPEGLGGLYRSSGGTFSAHIDEQQLQDLMQWYDETLQGADSPEATATVADCPEATATEDDRPVATVADCPKL
ncbi:hypothetical protein DL768_010168 [Monosporascus sp. mg162]|nr:hypothetical protein DL768_010168 [Monosporascus sp. mg162]